MLPSPSTLQSVFGQSPLFSANVPQLKEMESARRKFLGLAASPPAGPSREERMRLREERRNSEEPLLLLRVGVGLGRALLFDKTEPNP